MNPSDETPGLQFPDPAQVPAGPAAPGQVPVPQPPAMPPLPGAMPPAAAPDAQAVPPAAPIADSPMTLPLPAAPPAPGQIVPQNASPTDVQATTDAANPTVVDDDDLIEKEWVNKAKQIVEQNRNDPYKQSEELTVFRADYMKKRYNKNIKVDK